MRLTFLLALTLAVASACGAPKTTCDAKSCATGRCTPNGECLQGTETLACGTGGAACVDCSTTSQVCGQNVCIASPVVDSGTPFMCTRTPVECSDQVIQGLGLFSNVAAGAVTNAADTGGGFKATIDATGGGFTPSESYVYVRFGELGLEKLNLDDMTALDSMDWDLAFRRFVIRINSGDSGPACVGAQQRSEAYDALVAMPNDFLPEGDDFITRPPACGFVDDGSGLGTSPRTKLATFYNYAGCVQMTKKTYVVQTHSGRHVKVTFSTYYATEAAQTSCDTTGSSGGAAGGTIRMRWSYLD
jgi:hypothetical protein